MQHKITKFILSASVLGILCGCGSATKFQKKDYMGVFRSDRLSVGFKLDDKFKDWEIREGIPEAVVACRSPLEGPNDKFRENFVINTAPAVTTPAALDEAIKEITTEMPGFKLIDKHQDEKSTYITFNYSSDSGILRARTYFLQTDSSPIRVTFTSLETDFDRWLPSFEALLADIKIHTADLPAVPTPTPTPTPGSKSGTPAATGTPEATPAGTAPAASATPAVTGTPAATPTPASTGTPAATSTPVATSTPASATPAATTPAPTATPK